MPSTSLNKGISAALIPLAPGVSPLPSAPCHGTATGPRAAFRLVFIGHSIIFSGASIAYA